MTVIASFSPQLVGVPVAVLALGVAILGFIASAFSIGWQIVKHVLDGGRVKVYLNAAIWEPGMALYTNRSGRFRVDGSAMGNPIMRRGTFEVAQLVVENPGRTAITIYSPGIAASGTGLNRYTATPQMFATGDGLGPDASSMETVVRLEPYDRVTFLLDYWGLMPRLRRDAGGATITLRGFVSVAGRTKRPQRSSWRRRWHLSPQAFTSLKGDPPQTPFNVLWRALYVATPTEDGPKENPRAITKGLVAFVLEEAMSRFEERPDMGALSQAIEEIAVEHGDRVPMLQFGLLEGYRRLDELDGHLTAWTESIHGMRSKRKPPPPESEGVK